MPAISYECCTTCGEWGFSDTHRCPPIWQCRVEGCHDDDQWLEYYARMPDTAALKMAENHDADELELINRSGMTIIVIVRDADGENEKRFRCRGEAVPTYYATEIRDTETGES